ncbi:sterol-4-alpha-carboxylate 3-dehydrogenase, decarboxylating [Diplogelasinospora grovesii]|uniref:Sterol-4-alpha-carboxylate 3-dehydrogenase, decarboxylating n=1 Tax=Diplogelasinospora grovesii TaxID=303347 RepID=A0AAN6NA86_9PEZI|nr:sterol-4-alpha-carboxylate 3-dehydrogenase, decarboxylating [Diplogelasinospora grovesii]
MAPNSILAATAAVAFLGFLWLYRINSAMKSVPREALERSPRRWTLQQRRDTYDRVKKTPIDFTKHLPPRQDRRYIIVGGSGLVGGDIVLQLLQRGQPPASIRVVDYQPIFRKDMLQHTKGVDFVKTDITSSASVEAAFAKRWPASVAKHPLTVFHTAAVIRAGERNKVHYDRCQRVNVGGTANVLNAARTAWADIFISTSSASVAVTPITFWVWPWETSPRNYLQILDESDFDRPLRPHGQYFGNYGLSKAEAERLVCGANRVGFRTGCIRPGNGIYGQSTDPVVGHSLQQGNNVSWTPHVIQNFVASRNVALAHLQLEAALAGKEMPKCAGRPFVVTDPNPPPSFKELYDTLHELSVTPTTTSFPPPVLLLIVAHMIEGWCLMLHHLPILTKLFGLTEPGLPVSNLQPGVFTVSAHTIANDSAARKSVEDGGFGYTAVCTSLEGICEQIADWNREHEAEKGNGSLTTSGESKTLTEKIVKAGLAPEPVGA